MAAGEFGDKTQLITISLAVQYGTTAAIWAGEMLAIAPVSLLNAYLFHRFVHRFDLRKVHFGAAALFAFFGLDTLLAMVTGYSHATPLAVRVSMARWERNPTATAILSVSRRIETRIAPTTNPPATGVCISPR